jgi:hypothetical protein
MKQPKPPAPPAVQVLQRWDQLDVIEIHDAEGHELELHRKLQQHVGPLVTRYRRLLQQQLVERGDELISAHVLDHQDVRPGAASIVCWWLKRILIEHVDAGAEAHACRVAVRFKDEPEILYASTIKEAPANATR